MASVREALCQAALTLDRAEARILLAFTLQCSKESLITHSERNLSAPEEKRFLELVHQASGGTPIPYLTGSQAFWKYDFFVNEHVLIPRPDTELLIEKVLEFSGQCALLSILDLGTGSGCIAITLAKELPSARVTAVDVSAEALKVAQQNAGKLGAPNVTFRLGSWYEPLPEGQCFDIIASNPPYIVPGDPHLAALTHEPLGALTDGDDGLSYLKSVVFGAKNHLNPQGLLVVEHGFDQGGAVRALFQSAGFCTPKTEKDLGGNDRITFAKNV